jgi:hypothetical protein
MILLPQAAPPPASSEPWTRFRSLGLGGDDYRCLLGLLLLFAVEALMFYTQLADQILPYYPRYFDQIAYAVQTYHLIDSFHTEGWSAFLHQIAHPSATGLTFVIQGALLSLVGGANRGAFVSLNLLYFIALQICLYVTVRSRTGSTALAWVAIAFLLSARTHFNFAGGLYDYRIDHSVLCLYGIWCCLLLATRGFRNRSATVGFGLVSVLLVLERFFTILYIGTILACLFMATLMVAYFARTPDRRAPAVESAKNLFFCGAAILLIAAPFLFLARHAIFDYYIVGHFLGIEKNIRAAENGVSSLFDDLIYYPRTLQALHFGTQSLEFIAIVLAGVALASFLSGGSAIRRALHQMRAYGFEFLALALASGVPLVFLTLDYAKSPVVGGIITVPCILLIILLSSALILKQQLPLRRFLPVGTQALGRLRAVPPLVCVVIGSAMFLTNGTAPQHSLNRADLERINSINNAISNYIIDDAMPHPRISFDRVIEYLNAGTVQLFGYEGWRHFIDIVPEFGYGNYGIFATPRDIAMNLLQESDIVVLSDPLLGREHSFYPMDTKIRDYWGDMWQWTNENLLLLYETNINGVPYRVFHRPTLKSEGGSGGWVSSQGLTLIVNRSELARWPFLILKGDIDPALLGGVPQPHAVVSADDKPGVELPAGITVANDRYRIAIDARAAAGSSGRVKIKLTFDRYFTPKQRGINGDTRELVVRVPTSKELQAKENDQ